MAIVAADALEGDLVVGRGGERLGTIADVLVDVERGTVAYAVMANVAGDRMLAIPWSALSLDEERRRFVLQVEPARLEGAPTIDLDAGPPLGDAGWAADVHRYYGVEPYWSGSGRGGVLGSAGAFGP